MASGHAGSEGKAVPAEIDTRRAYLAAETASKAIINFCVQERLFAVGWGGGVNSGRGAQTLKILIMRLENKNKNKEKENE